MLNIVCVNHGNYLGRGADYVRRLRDAVELNLTRKYAFHVIEDVSDVTGWWAKLAMFQPGRFEGRCVYFDLDTVITGSIDHMTGYSGSFAMLEDFYYPQIKASGVMMWSAGEADHIWSRWDSAGRPSFDKRGDGGWIDAMMPNALRLQTLFPGQIVSFKKHCMDGVPANARVVCFHGRPRPHVLSDLMSNW